MRYLLLVITLLLSGCYIGKKDKIFEERDGLLYGQSCMFSTLCRYTPYEGKIIEKYPNGQIKWQENYVNGKQHGAYTEWREDGTVRFEATYEDGKYIDGGEVEKPKK